MNTIKALIKPELCNLYGINVLRHTKDRAERRKKYALTGVILLLLVFAAAYTGSSSYMLIRFGAGNAVLAYLAFFSSLFSLIFGIFKSGGTIFQKKGYDTVSAFPVKNSAVVFCKAFRLYIESLLLTVVFMLPGLVVYAVLQKITVMFFISALIGILCVPLIPTAVSAAVSAVIMGIASKMRNKAVAEAVLSLLLMLGVFMLMPSSSSLESMDEEALKKVLGTVSGMIANIYPPATWFGKAADGSIFALFLFAGASVMIFAVTFLIISFFYRSICGRLFERSAKHNYTMQKQEKTPLTKALIAREAKHYFSSGVYMSNTVFGPLFALVLSVFLVFIDAQALTEKLPALPFTVHITHAVPFVFAAILCLSSPASVSVSIEGKDWWITKSLPLSATNIANAKLGFSFCLLAPFYVVSEIIFMASQDIRPAERLGFIIIPVFAVLFTCTFGLFVNLKLPKMKWESETAVVKQSASGALGGIIPSLALLVSAFAAAAVSDKYIILLCTVICAVLAACSLLFYGSICRTDLRQID